MVAQFITTLKSRPFTTEAPSGAVLQGVPDKAITALAHIEPTMSLLEFSTMHFVSKRIL